MIAAENNIIVRVDLEQKNEVVINNNTLFTGRNYNENFRERNPVLAYVEQGLGEIKKGQWIVCNYSHFDWSSPFLLYDNLFSIPVDEEIFARVLEDGTLSPVCGNVIVTRVKEPSFLEFPPELVKEYHDRGYVANDGMGYKKGDFIFWLQKSDHEIVYFWNGEERRTIKIFHKEIVGVLKNI